jgi:crotonobetainyl-CoA:carnitine CoA-transferase CaiB-like acyl-CoA transferase
MAPHDLLPCAGDDRWLAIAIDGDAEWTRLCAAIGRPELAGDARFATVVQRRRHQDELVDELSAWSRQHSPIAAMRILQAADVRAGALHTTREVLDDEQLRARGFFETIDAPAVGTYPWPGPQARLSATPLHIRRPAPRLGEDNHYLYREVLEVTAAEYEDLVREEHIGTTYVAARQAEAAAT